jgi:4-amino-4-deoxy-L-arabinose transferase-like glycosyltransferase
MSSEPESIVAPPRRRWRPSWRHWTLLAILLLGAFLRVWRLGELPPGLYHDEAYNGLDALSLLDGDTFPNFYEGWELYAEVAHQNRPVQETKTPIFFEGNYGREPLHVYLMALSIAILGPTPMAIRLVPALAGVMAILTTYLAASALLDIRQRRAQEAGPTAILLLSLTPLLAAFTMAVLYPAVTFSRFGLRAMLFVPLEALAVYCFWRGMNAADRRLESEASAQVFSALPLPLGTFVPGWFAAAGLFMGLGVYTYAAARLLPLVFVAFVILWFLKNRQGVRQHWGNLALMAGVAFLVALPLLIFYARYPYFFIFRSRYVANRGANTFPGQPWKTWFFNGGRVMRGLIWLGETHLRHNLPGRPFIDPIQVILGGLGLLSMIGRDMRRRHIFLILWLLIMILPSVMSGDAPHFGRMIGAAPPLAITIAMGAAWLGQRLIGDDPQAQPWRPVAVVAGLMLLFLVSAGLTTRDYFQRYAQHPDLPAAFYLPDWTLGQYAAELPESTTVYLSPTQEQMATIYFALGGQLDRLRSFYSPDFLLPAGNPGQPTVYLLRAMAEPTLLRLQNYFPGGQIGPQPVPEAAAFVPFAVPAGAARITAPNLADLSWAGAITLKGWSAGQADSHLDVTLIWQAQVPLSRAYTAYVHLLDANGQLVTQLDRQPEGYPTSDWHPGEVIVDTYRLELPDDYVPGLYTLQSGFYYLATLERLGEPLVVGQVTLD